MQIPRYVSGAKNNYLYNGDEWQNGANVYDAINRGYDPTLGRFWQVDAMAEKYVGISAFAFVGNNPIGYSDPIGLEMQKWNGGNNWQDILTWIQHANSGDGIYFDPDDHLPDVTVMGHVVNFLSTQMSNDDAIIAALQELNKHRETISELRPENQISNWQAWLHRFNGKYNPYTRLFEAYYGKSQASYWNESLSPSDRVKAFADFAVAG
ncbi:MAG TPA: RHS repeat-associated core domain-containing protein, partial [Arachidicoccus soli]|nr:RHS repeat-associated core domain-containing protein [Arachidicoccus soli]